MFQKFSIDRSIPIILILVVVFGPVLFLWLPKEYAKWQIASALELQRDGKPYEALEKLKTVAEQYPRNYLVQTTLLQHLSNVAANEMSTKESLGNNPNIEATLEKIRQIDQFAITTVQWGKQKANAYHNIGYHQQAYQIWVKVFEEEEKIAKRQHETLPNLYPKPNRTIGGWNNLTYFSALADQPEETLKNLSGLHSQMRFEWEMQFLRYRCLGLSQVGQPQKALNLLNLKVKKFERILLEEQAKLSEESFKWISNKKFPGRTEAKSVKEKRIAVTVMRTGLQQLAKLQIHLMKVTKKENSEIESVQKGWENEFRFADLDGELMTPSVRNLCGVLRDRATYLDTRGFARIKTTMWSQALEDLDAAIEAIEIVTALEEQAQLFNTQGNIDQRDIEWSKKEFRKSKATYYYHRSLIHQRQKHPHHYLHDLKMVKDLGFHPSPALF